MEVYGGMTGGSGMGYGNPGPNAPLNQNLGAQTHIYSTSDNVSYPGVGQFNPHGQVHAQVHGHGCAPVAKKPVVIRTGVSPVLVLFILLVIIIRCAHQ